ncbi:adhesin [Streptomyces sp. NPDC005805]|uniref:adhesin n=1 Tax=Streptomyces sp. NPDC005805 TaxID=3157068 RepID=UPI0033FB8975
MAYERNEQYEQHEQHEQHEQDEQYEQHEQDEQYEQHEQDEQYERHELHGRNDRDGTGRGLRTGAVALALLALGPALTGCGPGDEDGPPVGAAVPTGAGPGLGGLPQRNTPSPDDRTAAPDPSPSVSPSLPRPRPKPPAASPSPSHRPDGPSYEAWAGPGCTGGGRYEEEGRYTDGDDGWYTVHTGGHRGDGCDGRFSAVPMSGSRSEDSGGSATWSWFVGSGYRTCTVAVVVPEPARGRERDAAGDPTTYLVLADPDDPDSAVRTFEVDQTALRGQGVVIEKVPVHDRRLTVRLVDRGVDWGRGRSGAHHAAAQMRAECGA